MLTGLTSLKLSYCHLAALPAELSVLPLAELDLTSCDELASDAAFEPLLHLGGSLRVLTVHNFSLQRVPAPLGALSCLQELHIYLARPSSASISNPEAASLCAPLQHLTALTSLTLGAQLVKLPRELSAMCNLKAANFEHTIFGQEATTADVWSPLQHLQQLSSLTLGYTIDRILPGELAACTALLELRITHRLKDDGAAWAPLQHLTCLTRLTGASGAGVLSRLPSSIMDVEMTGHDCLKDASEEVFAPLRRLTALTRLDFGGCGLRCFPQALSVLGGLQELILVYAHFTSLDDAAFQPLAHLTALTCVSFSNARLTAVPHALSAATALRDLDLGGSWWAPYTDYRGQIVHLELGHLSRLAPLTHLTRLVLSNTGTERLPFELSALHNLAHLALHQCSAMGEVGDAAFQPLRHMTSLTELILENTGMSSIPSQVSALASLRILDLTHNLGLAHVGAAPWRPLLQLHSLQEVNLSLCGIRSTPVPLAPLVSAGVTIKITFATEDELYASW